jgi:NAD(P)-dependent dehydrogenase (short-subunit alcohol dehydrogenase family)
MKGLTGKVAIVTAAAGGGIGKATAIRLAEEGAIVVVTDSHERRTRETVEEMAARFPGRIDGFTLDVSRLDEIDRTVGDVEARRGRIDILVNNAGINVLGKVDQINVEDWTRVLEVNLTGAFHLIRAVLPAMRRQRTGSIINVSSVAAWAVLGGSDAPYAAAKAGLLALTRSVAAEVGPDGIRCNAVAPGIILTKWVEKNMGGSVARQVDHTPLRRLGKPEDVAAGIAFLASDDASFVTGEALTISGGLYMHS